MFSAATDGSDYLGVSMDLVFTAGTSIGTMQCLNIAIIDTEATVEYNETFIVTLSSDMEQEDNVTTVTIVDMDGK